LTKAGVRAPALDRSWGKLLHASAGWSLSGPEYLAFARLLRSGRTNVLNHEMHSWLLQTEGRWIDDRHLRAYTLGVNLRVITNAPPNLFHGGGWVWRQDDAKGGAIHEVQWTWFVMAGDGVAWFASFSGKSDDDEKEVFDDLDHALWQARRAVTWPTYDLFP